jgi:mannose-6-phosphate isomerase-like protein (cupin superfamily)
MRYVFDTKDKVHYRFPTHTNDLVMDRSEAETSEAFLVVLEPGEAPPLHVHDDTEQVFYVLRGAGTLQIGADPSQRFPVAPGNLVRIPRGSQHRIFCEGSEPLEYLSVDCFVGGRPKDEPTWESHVRVMCQNNGWDFDKVR